MKRSRLDPCIMPCDSLTRLRMENPGMKMVVSQSPGIPFVGVPLVRIRFGRRCNFEE